MKKTVSINISGVIFHIEEDGYDKLKQYLSSIQQYFSTYEDSQEIVTDIENRVAEKLLAKLKVTGSQVVTLDDVNELVGAMGTVADFEAVEDEEIFADQPARHAGKPTGAPTPTGGPATGGATRRDSAYAGSPGQSGSAARPRQLARDLRRKTIGGVASGIANYFNIDPVWVRLAFVTLFIGLPALNGSVGNHGDSAGFFGSLSGFTFIAYIAMWIAFPGSNTLEDDKSVKKFFRNPDDKVLGGVASGLGAYFGVETGLVRLVFVLGIVFFGVGLLAYFVLWMIAPPANSLTEKMEMQGQPITLTNIEQTIKTNLNVPAGGPENGLATALLFPFRVIAMLFAGLGRALGPVLGGLVTVIRVFAGIIVLIVAFSLIVATLAAGGVALGLYNGAYSDFATGPFELFRNDLSLPLVLAGLTFSLISCFWLVLVGVWLITTRAIITTRTGLTLLGIEVVSLLILVALGTSLMGRFRKEGTVERTEVIAVSGTPTFDINDIDADYGNRPSIDLKGHAEPTLKLVEYFKARGRNRADAERNAQAIQYKFTRKDSVVQFDNSIELGKNPRFRQQDLDMDLFMPYEKPFRMTERFARYIRNRFSETELDRMGKSIWKFTNTGNSGEGELVCINFPRDLDPDTNDAETTTDDSDDEGITMDFSDLPDGPTRQFDVKSFTNINAAGAFLVNIVPGDTFKVVAKGSDDDINDMQVRVEGNTLTVDRKRTSTFDWSDRQRIGLTVTMPTVEKISLSGASQVKLSGFKPLKLVAVDLTGACKADINTTATIFRLALTGGSKAQLRGTADQLNANLTGACKLDATAMRINRADVEATGACKAELGIVKSLSSNATGVSKITRQNSDVQ